MSNTFLMAGEEDPEAILRETPHGILVSRLEGGRMDPATGDFRFRASAGRLIEAGRLTAPLRPFTLAGNGPAALRAVARVGSDLSFGDGTGSCGKDGQQLPVAAGLPTVLLASLAVRPG
jgi:TldD protein